MVLLSYRETGVIGLFFTELYFEQNEERRGWALVAVWMLGCIRGALELGVAYTVVDGRHRDRCFCCVALGRSVLGRRGTSVFFGYPERRGEVPGEGGV